MKRRRLGATGWPRLVAIGVVVGVVIALAFFVRGFDDTGPDDVAAPPVATSPAPVSTPTPSATRSAHGATKYVVPGTGQTISLGANDGGLVIDTRGQHTLTLRVSSARPMYGVGYLVPTSLDHPYGKQRSPGRSWSMTTTVTGKPYYAVLWIAAGRDGAPATCTITLDGKVRVSKTTSGSYGRQVCYA